MVGRLLSILFLMFVIACQSNPPAYQPPNLRKLGREEIIARAQQKLTFSPYAVFKDSLGNPLSDEYREKLDKGQLTYDYYANEENEVLELIVRIPTYEDDILDIQKRAAISGMPSWQGVEPMAVDCKAKRRILRMVYKREKEIQAIKDSVGLEKFAQGYSRVQFRGAPPPAPLFLPDELGTGPLSTIDSATFEKLMQSQTAAQAAWAPPPIDSVEANAYDVIQQLLVENKGLVLGLLEKCSVPTKREVGEEGMEGLFYTIQHGASFMRVQYYPIIKQCVEKGDLKKHHQAILEDGMMRDFGKEQLYGSQLFQDRETKVWRLYKVRDRKNLDQRRKAVGLEPIEDYLKSLGIDYDLREEEGVGE